MNLTAAAPAAFHIVKSNYLLSLSEIAAWQVLRPVQPGMPGELDRALISAELPAMQRGAVWNAARIEFLWDSLVRGFPVGSFLIAPFDDGLGHTDYKLARTASLAGAEHRFHLLDGQQRATAIAIGFLDLWSDQEHPDGPALWVDLAVPVKQDDDRGFQFRVLTRSHPWGYSAADPNKILPRGNFRRALANFRIIAAQPTTRAAKLALRHAWPWDAICPIPVPLLIAVALKDDWRSALEARIRTLPMWHEQAMLAKGGNLIEQWQLALQDGTELHGRLTWLIGALRAELETRTLPASLLRERHIGHSGQSLATMGDKASVKSVETLFVRINSLGVSLDPEELIYSSLKAAWPEAPKALERLQDGRQIIAPAHMVRFLHRLYRAFGSRRETVALPGTTDVALFRQFMRDPEKLNLFQDFVQGCKPLIDDLVLLVRLESGEHDKAPWRLPPTLAARLFFGARGLDILFIACAWLFRLKRAGLSLANLSPECRARSLGFLVALHTFSQTIEPCIQRLWLGLITTSEKELADFFNAARYRALLIAQDGKLAMLPLVPPAILESLVASRVTRSTSDVPGLELDDMWKSKAQWTHYIASMAPDSFTKLEAGLQSWLSTLELEDGAPSAGDEANRNERRRFAWSCFLDKLWSQFDLVDYAQRHWLLQWFPDFDPTLPGQMEDMNRPWDHDHIHAKGLTCNELPSVIRDWHTSIGNYRDWPLELNRSDQDDPPYVKLDDCDRDDACFGLHDGAQVRAASFIGDDDWVHWRGCVPASPFKSRYLALHPEYAGERRALVEAITTRFCALYRHWHAQLRIGDLQE